MTAPDPLANDTATPEATSPHEKVADLVVGTVWNPAGLLLAKSVHPRRAAAFAQTGLGASSTWHGFTIDQGGIAFTPGNSAVGDLRLRLQADAVRTFTDGFAWGPVEFRTQDGDPVAECTRSALRLQTDKLAEASLAAQFGHELEFSLHRLDGEYLPTGGWAPYSLAGVQQFEPVIRRIYELADEVGLQIDQLHAEYAIHQLEMSLAPAPPVEAADNVVLARIVISRAAREAGLAVSFSPKPSMTTAGNGAHQHFSLTRIGTGEPLFSGGSGPRGLTEDGAAAIAAIVSALPELQGIFAGSLVSATRLAPGTWSGAYCSWGLENREVAVRLIGATPANPEGANVEVKIIDPSASAYLASAAILAAALDGITNQPPLPPEANQDPGSLSEAEREAQGIGILTSDPTTAIDALDKSTRVRSWLGDALVNAAVSVRRYEIDNYADLSPDNLTAKFRLAWSL